jgi:hypothetical protein
MNYILILILITGNHFLTKEVGPYPSQERCMIAGNLVLGTWDQKGSTFSCKPIPAADRRYTA